MQPSNEELKEVVKLIMIFDSDKIHKASYKKNMDKLRLLRNQRNSWFGVYEISLRITIDNLIENYKG